METDSPVPSAPAPSSCAICLSQFDEQEERVACPDCQAHYHAECWTENEGCAAYGCGQAPEVQPRTTLEIPVSYWGEEHKPCPACANQILAAAVRCRHCGTIFQSARPEDRQEYLNRGRRESAAAGMRLILKILFICCLLLPLAPIGGPVMLIYYLVKRKKIRELPSIYDALAKIGIAVAAIEIIAFVVIWILYSRENGF